MQEFRGAEARWVSAPTAPTHCAGRLLTFGLTAESAENAEKGKDTELEETEKQKRNVIFGSVTYLL